MINDITYHLIVLYMVKMAISRRDVLTLNVSVTVPSLNP